MRKNLFFMAICILIAEVAITFATTSYAGGGDASGKLIHLLWRWYPAVISGGTLIMFLLSVLLSKTDDDSVTVSRFLSWTPLVLYIFIWGYGWLYSRSPEERPECIPVGMHYNPDLKGPEKLVQELRILNCKTRNPVRVRVPDQLQELGQDVGVEAPTSIKVPPARTLLWDIFWLVILVGIFAVLRAVGSAGIGAIALIYGTGILFWDRIVDATPIWIPILLMAAGAGFLLWLLYRATAK